MFINVRLLNGFQDLLTYKIPDDWEKSNLVGSLVKVPLKLRSESAIIEEVFEFLPATIDFKIRDAYGLEKIPDDQFYYQFIAKLSSYYAIDRFYFLRRLKSFLKEKEIEQEITTRDESITTNVNLTDEQQFIVDAIKPAIATNIYYPALIHGVTGSGKTEVYKNLIVEAINQQKCALLLLPEVSLAVQFAKILKKTLPSNILIYSFHSAASITEKKQLWSSLLAKQPVVIIGVHMPLLLPLPNLGIIIIDEEHDVGYQEKKFPKINTKEAALISAHLRNIPIVMGSATPSISSMYNAEKFSWKTFELKKRFCGVFPQVKLVKLTESNKRKNFWISKELENAIAKNLTKKEQVIIFLNRRGYSFFIICKKCGFIPNCCNCSVSLTLHESGEIKCHYCGYIAPRPTKCSDCGASDENLLKKGIGTQQVVTILEKLFPNARIARADLDTTVNKKKWQTIMTDFENGDLDILVGTQTITKGYHFPKVTLVGILWADINLSLPVYNAAEVSLQQLIQVAGRAGRQSNESLVIIQTMIEHSIYNYINEVEYKKFYAHELNKRELTCYPPVIKLAEIELRYKDDLNVEKESIKIANQLQYLIKTYDLKVKLLGPTAPPVHTIKNIHIRKIYIKSQQIKDLIALYKSIDKQLFKSTISFTPNPLN